ncbi:MAG: hypothetical protein KDB94_09105, partial [Acidobacteria bacterium]|nr:hypothetical protein [Acidobacteriota bacterium]
MDSAGNWFKIASLLFAAASVGIGARNILPTPTAEPHRLPQVAADAQPIPDPPQLRRLPPVANAEPAIRDPSVRPASHELFVGTQVVRTSVVAPEPFSSAAITLTNVDDTRSSHTITESQRFRTKDATISIRSTVPSAFNKDNHLIALDIDGARKVFTQLTTDTFESGNLTLSDRVHQLRLLAVEKADSRIEVPLVTPITFAVAVRTSKIRVIDVDQSGFAFVKPPYHLKIVFDTSELELISASTFEFRPLSADSVPGPPIALSNPTAIPNTGAVQLVLTGELNPGNYLLRVIGGTTTSSIRDVYGNVLEG